MTQNPDKPIGDLMIRNVRLAFPNLFEPKERNNENGTTSSVYGASFILPKDHPDVARIKETIKAVATAKWKDKAPSVLKALAATDRTCLHNGDAKSEYDGFEGNLYVSANCRVRPLVIDTDKSPLTNSDGRPYSGCYVYAKLEIWAQDNAHGKRVNAQLKGVQFYRDGEAFGGGGKPADVDEFAELEGVDGDEFKQSPDVGDDPSDDPLAGMF